MIRRLLLVAVLVAAQAACVGVSSAASPGNVATWTGGAGTGSWSGTSNWITPNISGKPTTSGTWSLFFTGTTQTTNTNDIGIITLGTMAFTNDGSAGKTTTFTLSGSTLALNNGSIVTTATNGGSIANAGDTVGTALALTGSNTFMIGAGHNLTVAGAISGGGSLQVRASNESGWLYLTNSNSYSGGTTITSGLVQNGLRSSFTDSYSNAFGTGNIVVSGSGTIQLRNDSTITNNFTIGGNGALSSGTAMGALRGSFGASTATATVSGSIGLSSDALVRTAGSASGTGSKMVLSGPVVLGSNTLTLAAGLVSGGTSAAAALPIEVRGVISGSGAVIVASDSFASVLLSGTNTYTGGSTLTAGTLRVGSANALGAGFVAVNAGTLDLNGQNLQIGTLSGSSGAVITSNGGAASLTTGVSGNSTYGGSILDGSGAVSLTKNGTGGLYLTGSSNYSGGTTVTEGVLQNGSRNSSTDSYNNAFGTGGVVVSGSGTVQIRNNSTVANNFTIGGAGSGALGALRGSFGTSGTATLTGTVALSADATVKTAAPAGVTGSKMVLSGPVNLGSNTLTLAAGLAASGTTSASALPIEVSGRIAGTGSVVIANDPLASVLLSGSSSYSGGTRVDSGTLRVGDGHAVGTGALTVNSGGILDVNGQALSVGSLQLNSGATVDMGISGTASPLYAHILSESTVAFGGALAIDFGRNDFVNGDAWQLFSSVTDGFSGHFLSVAATGAYGDLTFNYADGEWKADLGSGRSMSFYENDNHAFGSLFKAGQLVVVPEPSTLMIAGIGVFIAGWQHCKRRRQARRTLLPDGANADTAACSA